MFTLFMDMHSGGDTKQDHYEYIYIELPEDEAVEFFERKFGHDPYGVACSCCGSNYSIDSAETLEESTAYERRCEWVKDGYDASTAKITLSDYVSRDNVLVITLADMAVK